MRNFILILMAFCANPVSAETIYIWHNGIKTELAAQVNDSITFDEGNTAVMRIWRDAGEIYQLTLAANDSITCVEDKPDVPEVHAFDYDHWREQKVIKMYDKASQSWIEKYLPWNLAVSSVTMPETYRYPNEELNNDSTPVWELAFNLFSDSIIDHGYMFGLWDRKCQIMRIYSYIDEFPGSGITYCYYKVSTSISSFVEADNKVFMPSDAIIRERGSWNASALNNNDAVPSTTDQIIQPIQREQNPINGSCWVCFDINLSSGHFDLPENRTITFSMYGIQEVSFAGTASLDLALQCEECGGTQTGQITTPGNKDKVAAARLSAVGSGLTGIVSAIAEGVSTGKDLYELMGSEGNAGAIAGAVVGIVGATGAICSSVGSVKSAKADTASTVSTLKSNLTLDMNFHGTASGGFNGQLTSVVGTNTGTVTLSYEKFYEEVLKQRGTIRAPQVRQSNSVDTLSLGVWNLKNQPVIYVCADTKFEDSTLISFLDPSSIELVLNKDNVLYDYDQIDSIQLVAYDFAFVDDSYTFSTQPYYDFYGIPRDAINATSIVTGELKDSDYLLVDTAEYQIFTKNGISYMGVSSQGLVDAGLKAYNLVCSPRIRTTAASPVLNNFGVSVLLEITFKDGQKCFFADRFLPQIKAFKLEDAHMVIKQIQEGEAPTVYEDIPFEMPLFNQQKDKALRMLYTARFPIATMLIPLPFGLPTMYYRGIRIRSWESDNRPGIVIRSDAGGAGIEGKEARPSYQTLVNLRHYLLEQNIDIDQLSKRFEKFGFPSLNNGISTNAGCGYNLKTGEQDSSAISLFLYTEDENGDFSAYPITEDMGF